MVYVNHYKEGYLMLNRLSPKPEEKSYLASSRKFSTFDIIKALDIDRERLREWMNWGYIKPSQSAQGQGTRASFSILDVYGVEIFRNLVEAGFSREAASIYADKIIKEEKRTKYEIEVIGIRVSLETIHFFQIDSSSKIKKLDLRTGTLNAPMSRTERKEFLPENLNDWDRVYLINIKKIKKKVDEALAIRM